MIHSVYSCDDYQLVDSILTIYNGKEVAKVSNVDEFNFLVKNYIEIYGNLYNGIICPSITCDSSKQKPFIVVFK